MLAKKIRSFLFPRLTRKTRWRILAVTLLTFIVFRFILLPIKIQGRSMEPTILDDTFHLCYRLQHLFSPPKRFDIVTIRFAGKKILLLKRVVGLPGETISLQDGKLYINDSYVPEPHLQVNPLWNLAPRTIQADTFYVLGDNRSVPLAQHHFGAVSSKRIQGKMIW